MLAYVILGLLRDGGTAHGYQLATAWYRRAGQRVATSSFYRDLARLRDDALVEVSANPPGTDARRIPHRITDRGRLAFDRWLGAPPPLGEAFDARALFLDRVPTERRDGLLLQWRDELLLLREQSRLERDDALARRRHGARGFDPLPAVLTRHILRLDADLALVDDLRAEVADLDRPVDGCAAP